MLDRAFRFSGVLPLCKNAVSIKSVAFGNSILSLFILNAWLFGMFLLRLLGWYELLHRPVSKRFENSGKGKYIISQFVRNHREYGQFQEVLFSVHEFVKVHSFQIEFFNVSFKVIVHCVGCTNYNLHIRQSPHCLDFDHKICVRSNFVEPFSTDVIVVWDVYIDYAGHVCSFVDDHYVWLIELNRVVWSVWTEKFQRMVTLLFALYCSRLMLVFCGCL